MLEGVLIPMDANIISLMGKDYQYKSITELYLIRMIQVKSDALTINMRKVIIWKLLDGILNACFGILIKQFRENNLDRVNDVTFRTEFAVKSEKNYKN